MALKITGDCTACDACRPECPHTAISLNDTIYTIDPDRCDECVGTGDRPKCVVVCPGDYIIQHPDYVESREQLQAKQRYLVTAPVAAEQPRRLAPGRPSVGLIGVGLMGHGIARNVLKHGFQLAVMDHPGNQPLDELRAAGVRVVRSASDLARSSDVVILCVTGSPQVESILTGPDGVLNGLRAGTVIIDCSTSVPASTEKMAAAVHAAGGRFLDAPMTRLAKQAHDGTLNILVGGDAAVLEEMRPVLASFTESIAHVGPVGAGHRMKLLHNFVSLGFMSLLAEAAAHAELAGVDPAVLVDVLAKGGGAGTALQRMAPFMLTRNPSDVPFALSNALKDLSYYRQTASDSGAAHQIADAVLGVLDGVVSDGHGQAYVPELTALLKTGARR